MKGNLVAKTIVGLGLLTILLVFMLIGVVAFGVARVQ